jgi:hypothetical protein
MNTGQTLICPQLSGDASRGAKVCWGSYPHNNCDTHCLSWGNGEIYLSGERLDEADTATLTALGPAADRSFRGDRLQEANDSENMEIQNHHTSSSSLRAIHSTISPGTAGCS